MTFLKCISGYSCWEMFIVWTFRLLGYAKLANSLLTHWGPLSTIYLLSIYVLLESGLSVSSSAHLFSVGSVASWDSITKFSTSVPTLWAVVFMGVGTLASILNQDGGPKLDFGMTLPIFSMPLAASANLVHGFPRCGQWISSLFGHQGPF